MKYEPNYYIEEGPASKKIANDKIDINQIRKAVAQKIAEMGIDPIEVKKVKVKVEYREQTPDVEFFDKVKKPETTITLKKVVKIVKIERKKKLEVIRDKIIRWLKEHNLMAKGE